MQKESQKPSPTEIAKIWLALTMPDPEACQLCAASHDPEEPHALSVFYRARFRVKHGRSPTQADAINHCPRPIRDIYENELTVMGLWDVGEPQ